MQRRVLGSITAENHPKGKYAFQRCQQGLAQYNAIAGSDDRSRAPFFISESDYIALGRPAAINVTTKVEVIGR
ncbi:MAG: hypothetical protein V1887_00330 [Candidatus Aenigmatarchaeota archaeon]